MILFGDLLEQGRQTLESSGYSEMWYGWNGFDLAQDDERRRGGVRVWTKNREETSTLI
jgi:phosphatidylinositol glycan class B